MLRIVMVVVVAMAVFVFVRLVLLSFARPLKRETSPAPTIEAQPRFNAPMTVRKFEFKRFDTKTGPPDGENFQEKLTLHAAPEGSDDISIYSVTVATPRALARSVAMGPGSYAFQRNLLLVERYDVALIERALHEHVNEIVYLSGEGS